MKYFWLIIVACMFIMGCTTSSILKSSSKYEVESGKGVPTKEFSNDALRMADTALQKGISVDDAQNDWRNVPEGTMQWDKPDNPYPYPWPFTDVKTIQLGADETYLYMKFTFWGDFPSKTPNYEGDSLIGTGVKAMIDNKDMITADINYMRGEEKLDAPRIGLNSMITPLGEDEVRETIYDKMTGEGMVYAGNDYLLAAVPLHVINRTFGEQIDINFETESGSIKYHHESIDLFLEKGKFSSIVRYNIGSDNYTIIPAKDEYADKK